FAGYDGSLKDVVLVADVLNRLPQALGILQESHERADGDRVLNHLPAAVPDDRRDADGRDQVHQRVEDRVIKDRVDVGLQVRRVDVGELAEPLLLAIEELNGLSARNVLLRECVQPRDLGPNLAEAFARPPTEPGGGRDEQRHDRQRDEREPPVEVEHHPQRARDQHNVAEHFDQPRSEEFVERVDVGGQPGDQPPDRVGVVKRHLDGLELAEDLLAQVVHHALPDGVEQHVLKIPDAERDSERQNVNEAEYRYPVKRMVETYRSS